MKSAETGDNCGGHSSRTKKPCRNPAGFGTDHLGIGNCKHHGGNTPSGRKHAAKLAVRKRVAFLGDLEQFADLEPSEALLGVVRQTAALVYWLQERLQAWDDGTAQLHEGTTEGVFVDEYGMRRADVTYAYSEERMNLARTAKLAIDAGVEERRVAIAEQVGTTLVQVIRAVLSQVGVDPDSEQTRTIVYEQVHQLQLTAGGV